MRWDKCILPAIADRGDLYDGDTLLMRHGESLCPEILPLSYLEDKRRTNSRYWFECLYQQRPITQDGILWSGDCFPEDRWVDVWPARVKYLVVGVDPATGRALRDGDYSAIVALGIGYDGKLYCQADMDKTGPQETTERLARFCRKLPMAPDVIAIESNGFQFLMRTMAEETFANEDVSGRIEAYDTTERDVPLHKEDRIAELDPLIVSKDIHWVRADGTQLLVSQLQNFPSPDHDDGPDALELASWVLSNLN
jgi:predicted phage terminase large subunit-like protein